MGQRKDEAFYDVVQGIRQIVGTLLNRQDQVKLALAFVGGQLEAGDRNDRNAARYWQHPPAAGVYEAR